MWAGIGKRDWWRRNQSTATRHWRRPPRCDSPGWPSCLAGCEARRPTRHCPGASPSASRGDKRHPRRECDAQPRTAVARRPCLHHHQHLLTDNCAMPLHLHINWQLLSYWVFTQVSPYRHQTCAKIEVHFIYSTTDNNAEVIKMNALLQCYLGQNKSSKSDLNNIFSKYYM